MHTCEQLKSCRPGSSILLGLIDIRQATKNHKLRKSLNGHVTGPLLAAY